MLLCSLYLLVFLLLPNINSRAEEIFQYAKNKNTTPTYKQEESIFIDVIQNISRVNTALQELIENYEKIQKYYESNSFEKDLSSDAEIDQVYKNKKSNKRSKSISDRENTKSPRNEFPATMMIGSEDDESEVDNTDEEVKGTEKAVVESVLQTTEEPAVDKTSKKTVEKFSKEEYHKTIEQQPHVMSFKKSDQNHETGESNKKELPDISNHGARHNIDIKRTSAVSTTPSNPLQNKQFRKVEKVLRAEIFPRGMIWKEIAEKKPIKLRTLEFPEIQIQKVHFRSRPKTPKTAVLILAKNNKRTKNAVEIPSELEHVFSSESDVDTGINTAKVLRHADACIKMVVRKCWKACKEVKRIACRITTCKTSFKEKFLDNAKTGCIQAFKPPAPIKDNNETKTEDKKNTLKKHASSISSDSDDNFLDATRTGFPAETCYPFMVPQARSDNRDSNTTITPIDEKKQILRDRYERACARASSEKCEKGCLYAYKKTCDTLECGKGKKRAFHKHCRRQCKLAYKSKKVRKSSSSSSSSTSSSSDSDDSGDSDSFDTEDFE